MLTGIPEQSGKVDYIFLDPPAEFAQKDSSSDFDVSLEAAKAEFLLKFKGIARECSRILKSGGKVSVIVEPAYSPTDFLDFPYETVKLFGELGMKPCGKVYLPRRSSESASKSAQGITELRGIRALASDCRELLTFQKA